ncbi:hypothetical protein BS47DRAFT_298364 [Hydnum rufescens UP504]|uniref:BOD1/SHG1 domain-containing protein n=1 Tax=Hydnum rufescens UP504 TaxID=1448309 RepID=A0A9P6B8W3_9AGAM|nr:hypothetical protein BS47DRAFT_298364 [Hydnum rufescens UP504]
MPPKMTPKELVEEYKRSGKFDRLRREAMESFLASDHSATLTRRVDQIASDALQKVDHAHFVRQGQDALLGTIMNDLDRFPVVDRAMMAMSDSLKDDAFLRNIAHEVLNIINPPEPDKRDQTSPEPEANGVEPNHQTLANGNIHPDPFSIQNGVAIPVEGSATGVIDHTTGLIHGDADSMVFAHAPFTSQSQESLTPESAYDYDTNRPHDNGAKVSVPQQPLRSTVEDNVLIHRPPSSLLVRN